MKLVRYAKTGNIVSGAAFLMLGVIFMIFPQASLFMLCRAAGIIMLVSGVVRILGYFSKDLYYLAFQFDFALGILSVLFGAVLIIKPSVIVSAIQIFMGAFVLVNGLFALRTALDSKTFGMKLWWILFVFSVGSSLLGFWLIIHPLRSAAAVTAVIGVTLLLVGAEKIFVSVYTVVTKKVKEDKKYIDLSDYKDYTEGAE